MKVAVPVLGGAGGHTGKGPEKEGEGSQGEKGSLLRERCTLLQVLKGWLTSAKAWERERALQVCVHVLGTCKERFELTVSRDPPMCPGAPFPPFMAPERSPAWLGAGFRGSWDYRAALLPAPLPGRCSGSRMGSRGKRVLGLPATLFLLLSPAERMSLQAVWLPGGTAGVSDQRLPGHVPPEGMGLPWLPSPNAR